MHSNIASAAAKPAGAALPARADSQSRAEHVFGDMRHFFDTHAKFSAVVRLRNSSRECSPRASGARTKNQPNQCQSGEAEPIQAPGDVQGMDHWSDSFWMSKGSKHLFSKILNCTDVELPKAIDFPVEGLVSYLGRAGFDLEKFCEPKKTDLLPKASPGQWWRLDVKTRRVAGMASWEESHGTPTWTVALHGTSIRAASRILKSGFEPARNETAGVSGVYLEGIHRMENVLQYATHTHDEPLPLNFVVGFIVPLEAMIDPCFIYEDGAQGVGAGAPALCRLGCCNGAHCRRASRRPLPGLPLVASCGPSDRRGL